MSRFLITNGLEQGRVLRLKPGINRIGRSTANHFQIPDPSVSSTHCEVTFSDANVLVRDLNSTNGTYVDGEQIRESTIQFGQSLQLGNIAMRLERVRQTTEVVQVDVPELHADAPPTSAVLADGSATCANHPELQGIYKCTVCQQSLCEACVRLVRRVSGGSMAFCSLCAGACELVAIVLPDEPAPPPKKTLFARLTQTLKLPFKRNRTG